MPARTQSIVSDSDDEPPGYEMSICPQLAVDVQFGSGVDAPEGCNFVRWAQDSLRHICDAGWARDWLHQAGGVDSVELCIRLVDAQEGQGLNATWRNKNEATNVLSFPADILPAEIVAAEFVPFGDLVLCAPVVEREALEQNKHLADHYTHLCVHGVFHLLGYDHIVEAEADIMESREVAVLRELNVANPYD